MHAVSARARLTGGVLAVCWYGSAEVVLQLLVDRFVIQNGVAVDLFSGQRVRLIVSIAGGASDQARWLSRCDRFARLHHRHIAPLVDYGLMGEVHRFEAWGCDGPWTGEYGDAERAVTLARLFLDACALDDGAMGGDDVRMERGRAVVVPNAAAGYERQVAVDGEDLDAGLPLEAYGIVENTDRRVESISEDLNRSGELRPLAVGLNAPSGYGLEMLLRLLARGARINGYVPVTPSALDEPVLSLLEKRSLFVISSGHPAEAWEGLARLAVHGHRPRAVLFAGYPEAADVPTIRLPEQSVHALISAVHPDPRDPAVRRSVTAAARRAGGRPLRFRELLWNVGPTGRHGRNNLPRVAEHAVAYESTARSDPWPISSDVVALRQRLNQGASQLAQGRHAPGERTMRQVVAALARRHDWEHAVRGALTLSRSLIKRGRLKEVEATLAQAEDWARRDGLGGLAIDIAVLSGLAATDAIRLDEAETVLQTALMSARGLGETVVATAGALALARCLFWRGRFDEADRLLNDLASGNLSEADSILVALGRSRAAVGRGDLGGAIGHAVTATRLASQLDRPLERAAAACVSAFAHLAVGDHAAVEADVTACVAASKAARDPLTGLRAKLLAVESLRRAGASARAAALLRQLRRAASLPLPPIVRVRHALATDLLERSSGDTVARHVSVTGLRALHLFAPSSSGRGLSLHTVDDLVEVLRCCQASDEDLDVLASICQRLRSRMRAAGVAFFTDERGRYVPVASDGVRIEPSIAARVGGIGQMIAPHRRDERIEGGAPVRYGGRQVGALAVRWSLGSSPDPTSASVLLTTAATAAAPALAGALGRRAEPRVGGPMELLGASTAIENVRQAVMRAAPAPFPVLIEGESGSGKELVARALHRQGPRRDRPFCAVNCAALPDDLIESELFGHARGAFTGAMAERPGVFEEAHTGTLFLDEIGELSIRAQAKVLRTIQENEVRRVGENMPRRVDVRLVVATNRSLQTEVSAARFRLDLLYRLDVIRIVVPPLRERREDIPILAEHFWREAAAHVGSKAALGTAALGVLARYDWPGNVRELQNVLAALSVRSPKRGVIPPHALPQNVAALQPDKCWRLVEARRTFEAGFVRAALVRSGGHRGRAAEELGVTRQGLTKLLGRLGIDDSL